METIADRIKKAMELREIRQADLAEKTKISKGALSSYISGRYAPKQNNIYLIAKALNVNEAWLMGYEVPMERVSDARYAIYSDIDTIAFEITGRSLQYSPKVFDAICRSLDSLLNKDNNIGNSKGQLNLINILKDSNISYDDKALAMKSIINMVLFDPAKNRIQFFYTLDREESEIQMDKLINISKKLNSAGLCKVIDYATDLSSMVNYSQGADINKVTDLLVNSNKSYLEPQAAHERTDIEVTDEMRKHDDDLMDNDDIWNK